MIVVADTSGLIAASDKNAPESADCQAVLAEAGTTLAHQVQRQYAGLDLDLADGVNVALAGPGTGDAARRSLALETGASQGDGAASWPGAVV